MSEHDALVKLVEAKPTTPLPKKILADWMQEYKGLNRFAALRYAAQFGRDKVNAAEINMAVEVLDEGSHAREWLFTEVQEALHQPDTTTLHLYVVAGSRPPRGTIVLDDFHEPGELKIHVLVGARWLISRAQEMRFQPSQAEIMDAIRFGKEL